MWPWVGITFVVLGSMPYYALLDVLRLNATGPITGGVFGAAGLITFGWFAATRRPLVRNRGVVLSFVVFAIWWWIRWAQNPTAVGAPYDDFGTRAPAYMAVFAVIPLLAAQFARSEDDLRDMMKALALWGAVDLSVIAYYWVKSSVSSWQPVPGYSGILMAFDIGTGCLALLAHFRNKSTPWWVAFKLAIVAMTLATMVRISERGPFLFFLVAFALLVWRTRVSSVIRLVALPCLSVAAVALSLYLSETYGTSRVTTIENYSAESNGNRLGLWEASWDFFTEEPILGWGGSLVGKPMHSGEIFEYSHVIEIDPALETGFVGLVPFLTFLFAAVHSVFRASPSARALIGPPLLYAFLEAQVSGHVSSSRHLLFFIGVLCSVPAVLRARQPSGVRGDSVSLLKPTPEIVTGSR